MQNGQNGLGRNNSGRRRPWLLSVLGATALWGACDGAPLEQAAGEVTTDEEQNSLSPDVTPRCVTIKEGGATSCKDEKTWRGYGEASCKAKGLGLKSVMFANSCGMASWREATYTCCDAGTPPPPPPPPPPGMCITETLSTAAGLCIDDSTWKTRAEALCKAKGLSVKTLAFGTVCRASGVTGHVDVKVECCGPTVPPPPPPPGMCFVEPMKDPMGTCLDDAAWKTRAEAVCKAKGATVKNLTFGTVCRTMAGVGHSDARVECCGPTMPPPPPPPPPPGMCFVEPMKDPRGACLDDAAWKTRAEAVCKAKGATVKNLTFGTVCRTMAGVGHSDARVECCGPTVPPPPPPPVGRCTWNPLPSMGVCRLPDVWKREATTFCSTKMQTLHDLKLDKPCAMGGFVAAEAECCDVATPPPPPPPPPPPSMCVGAVIGDATKCQTEVALKSEAERTCNARGLKLTAFAAFDPCGAMAQYRQAKFTCCK